MLWQGVLVITAFVFSDLIDGSMARKTGRTDDFGAFLDSTLDRVADARALRRPRAATSRGRPTAGSTSCCRW